MAPEATLRRRAIRQGGEIGEDAMSYIVIPVSAGFKVWDDGPDDDFAVCLPDEDDARALAAHLNRWTPVHDLDVTYTPWTDGRAVGFRVTRDDGSVSYIYLNPSDREDSEPGDTPAVFLYTGPNGDPAADGAWHWYRPFDED